MKNNKFYNKKESSLILESISNIFYVSPSIKSEMIKKNNESVIDEIINNLLKCRDEGPFFIDEGYESLIIDILELNLATYSEDEIETYTGQDSSFIRALVDKIKNK